MWSTESRIRHERNDHNDRRQSRDHPIPLTLDGHSGTFSLTQTVRTCGRNLFPHTVARRAFGNLFAHCSDRHRRSSSTTENNIDHVYYLASDIGRSMMNKLLERYGTFPFKQEKQDPDNFEY